MLTIASVGNAFAKGKFIALLSKRDDHYRLDITSTCIL